MGSEQISERKRGVIMVVVFFMFACVLVVFFDVCACALACQKIGVCALASKKIGFNAGLNKRSLTPHGHIRNCSPYTYGESPYAYGE
jgi:hypothetical protein